MADEHILKDVLGNVHRYLKRVEQELPIEAAFLFGSYVTGTATEDSDIDLAIVSPGLSGSRFDDNVRLGAMTWGIDTRIEPVGFRPEDFTNEHLLSVQILKTGKRIWPESQMMDQEQTQVTSMDAIREMAGKIAEAFQPIRILLFGSYARGEAERDSDVDFLVISQDTRPRPQRSVPMYSLLRDYDCSKDILVYTTEEVEEYKDLKPSLISRALREGIVLYERPA